MAEAIKNFFNAAVAFNSSATLVNNNATTKALIKTISVCNQGGANTFDIKLDGITIYDDVAIAPKETIKLENENQVVSESKALIIKNNALTTYPVSLALVIAQNPLYTAVHVTQEGNYLVLFQNDTVSSYPYYAVYSPAGATLKAFTQITTTSVSVGRLRVTETDGYIHLAISFAGSNYMGAAVVRKSDWVVTSLSQNTSSLACVHPAVCRFTGSNNDYVLLAAASSGTLYLSATNSSTIFPALSSTTESGSPTYIRATGLTDGNALVCYVTSAGVGKMQKRAPGTALIGSVTQFAASVNDIFGTVALTNGTFAIVYRDAANSNYPTLAIFNDDLTVAVAAFTIRAANTMGMGDNQSNNYLFTDPDNNIYVVFQDTADGSKWKVTSYTSSGTLITADAKLNTMSTSAEDNVSFAADKDGNLIACYEPASALGQLNIDKLEHITSLNVTVSGVEVTA